MNNKELEEFKTSLKHLTPEELEQKIREYFLRKEQRDKEHREYERQYSKECNENHKELQSIYDEIENRKQVVDISNLEGSRTLFEVDILCEKGKYPISRESMAEWIRSFPGVKSVRVDDHEGEEIDDHDWDYCFQDFFEDKRPA